MPDRFVAWAGRRAAAAIAPLLFCTAVAAAAGDKPVSPLPNTAVAVETVRFDDPRWAPVRVFKGAASGLPAIPAIPSIGATTQRLKFGAAEVAIVRGPSAPKPVSAAAATRSETVRAADLRFPRVTIIRGPSHEDGSALFAASAGGELDRVAFAVDGAESGHGANPAMWRPGLDGPQGPMQVSAAAAFDVGGGDRFDLRQNRLLGRAYLAAMYRRYGNWPDAVAAYNWGPGNLDQWILAGRPLDHLPLETALYLLRVLRDAFLIAP